VLDISGAAHCPSLTPSLTSARFRYFPDQILHPPRAGPRLSSAQSTPQCCARYVRPSVFCFVFRHGQGCVSASLPISMQRRTLFVKATVTQHSSKSFLARMGGTSGGSTPQSLGSIQSAERWQWICSTSRNRVTRAKLTRQGLLIFNH